ncbi:condensation domain-containing protein [Allorhizocola rhizosphaerae]|uniref:condensation domain-containing protein n=1 Tax=Allorhizocola rhizosphaerae TaxID=1872709 RepID=UPI000E3E1695|nr:condensation domain-containing protein [Allorhizocola rhizosphaerae]
MSLPAPVTAAPLSFTQELLLRTERSHHGTALGPHVLARSAFALPERIDVGRLRAALDEVVAGHEALRTVLTPDGPIVAPPRPVPLTVFDSDVDIPDCLAQPIPIDDPPLLRAFAGPDLLLLTAHHSVADPWSLDLVARGLQRAAAPRSGQAATPRTDAALPYWERVLADLPPAPLPMVDEQPGTPPIAWPLELGSLNLGHLRRAARAAGTTPFLAGLTAYQIALKEITGTTEFAVTVLTSGRSRADWATVGFFMNAVVIRSSFAGRPTAAEASRRVRVAFAEACAHELPVMELINRLPAADRLFRQPGTISVQFELIEVPGSPAWRGLALRPPIPPVRPLLPFTGMQWALEVDPADESLYGSAFTWGIALEPGFLAELTTRYVALLTGFGETLEERL